MFVPLTCSSCHVNPRYSNSTYCKECHSAYMEKYRAKHRETIRMKNRGYMRNKRHPNKEFLSLLEKQNYLCAGCGKRKKLIEIRKVLFCETCSKAVFAYLKACGINVE